MLFLPLCIEGAKGSGKTTTIQNLVARMEAKGITTSLFAPFAVADDFARTQGFDNTITMGASSPENNRRVINFVLSSITATHEAIRAEAMASDKPHLLILDRGWMTLHPHVHFGKWAQTTRDKPETIQRFWQHAILATPPTAVLQASYEVTRQRRYATLKASGFDADRWIKNDLEHRQHMLDEYRDRVDLVLDTGTLPQEQVAAELEKYVLDKFVKQERAQKLRTKKKFVVLYGGSFNLATEGHAAIGLAVRDVVQPDEVWYLVSPQNPQKDATGMAAFHHRIEMTKLAVGNAPRLVVTDIEKEISNQTGSTYTSDTLRELIKRNPDTHFAFTVGADVFAKFHTWHEYEYILANASMIVIPRPGFTESAIVSPAAKMIPERNDVEDLRNGTGWHLIRNWPEENGSATEGRQNLLHGLPVNPTLVRPAVARYAKEHNVFGSPNP